jgi:quinol monooxygenase YgiN
MAMDNQAQGADREHAFAITVEFDLADGTFETFHRLVRENAELSVKLEPGCRRFDVLVPLEAASPRVFLYEIYDSRDAFAQHLKMEHYLSFDRATRNMVRTKSVINFSLSEYAKGLVSA